jgi:hypothetical protein
MVNYCRGHHCMWDSCGGNSCVCNGCPLDCSANNSRTANSCSANDTYVIPEHLFPYAQSEHIPCGERIECAETGVVSGSQGVGMGRKGSRGNGWPIDGEGG